MKARLSHQNEFKKQCAHREHSNEFPRPGAAKDPMTDRRLYEVLAAAFVAEGVDTHFTLLGDGNMHWGIELAERYGVRTIHARHEHCACEMASAYAHASGRVG